MTLGIVILSFLVLIVLHELGHYVFAKKFGVKVEEFGIGLPPRLFGKKIGETIYSLNLIPLGAFVRLEGEEQSVAGPRSFSTKPIWQKMIIVAAGVVAFWLVAILIFTGLGVTSGIPSGIDDEQIQGVVNPKVQILAVAKDSPAQIAGIELGDIVKQITNDKSETTIDPTTIQEIQKYTQDNAGEELLFTLLRGNEEKEIQLTPRINPPDGEGAMGVALIRSALVKYAWYEAPFRAIERTASITYEIVRNLFGLLTNLVRGQGVPEGVQFMGPVGIVDLLNNSLSLGIVHFLSFFAVLAVYLAIFNALPIPVVDGGKLLFLAIEAIRKKPISEIIEKRISVVVFVLLISMMIWVTIKDITRIF